MSNTYYDFETIEEKRKAYQADIANGVMAIDENLKKYPLKDFPIEKVEFSGGFWRVQREFKHKIQKVRDKEFVIGKELPIHESNQYIYYEATPVSRNCYGYFLYTDFKKIVAKFDGSQGTLWAYGDTVAATRAFLGVALATRHMETILRLEGKLKDKNTK